MVRPKNGTAIGRSGIPVPLCVTAWSTSTDPRVGSTGTTVCGGSQCAWRSACDWVDMATSAGSHLQRWDGQVHRVLPRDHGEEDEESTNGESPAAGPPLGGSQQVPGDL